MMLLRPCSLRPKEYKFSDLGIVDAVKRVAARSPLRTLLATHRWLLWDSWDEAVAKAAAPRGENAGPRLTPDELARERVRIGAILESIVVREATAIATPGVRVPPNKTATMSQLYFDAYAIATWTSAHAEWLTIRSAAADDDDHANDANDANDVDTDTLTPSVCLVPCAFGSYDVTSLYARRTCPKSCPKHTLSLLQMLSRATNPGGRGWEPVLQTSLKIPGVRRIVTREFEICFAGLHPHLHPSLRPDWKARHAIIHVTTEMLANEKTVNDVSHAAVYSKEVVRRLLASTLAELPAMHGAMILLNHPTKHLLTPPLELPHHGMVASMLAFVEAGKALADAAANAAGAELSMSTAIKNAFAALAIQPNRAQAPPVVSTTPAKYPGLKWSLGWLGKGGSDVVSKRTLLSLAGEAWSSAFKLNFIAFWAHSASHNVRATRLDVVQHAALHDLNMVTKMCAKIPRHEQLRINRLAMTDPFASLKTIEEVSADLNLEKPKNADGTLFDLSSIPLSKFSPKVVFELYTTADVTRLLFYARAAALRSYVTVFEMADSTARKQAIAMLYRHRAQPSADSIRAMTTAELVDLCYTTLPSHSTHICVCTCCQRVCNACVRSAATASERSVGLFNEFGIAQSMIRYRPANDTSGEKGQLLCARRASAALRSALGLREFMTQRKVENEQVADPLANTDFLKTNFSNTTTASGESGISVRLRRDVKNALDMPRGGGVCGQLPLVTLPIIGRAVRIYNEDYALCALCGALVSPTSSHKFGSEICCLRCDGHLLFDHTERPMEKVIRQKALKVVCRYCGSVDPLRSGVRWRQVRSPLDVAGANATLPAPLRRVWFCPTHYKNWLPNACRLMSSRVILAHIATGARPVDLGQKKSKELQGGAGVVKKQRRVKKLKP